MNDPEIKSTQEVEIRQFKPEDAEQVKLLNQEALREFGDSFRSKMSDLDNVEEIYFNNNGDFLVGIKDGSIVAMGAVYKLTDEKAEIKRLRVSPDYQGKGIGELMLGRLEDRARELGYKVVEGTTTIKQIPVQQLNIKRGYKEVRRETEGWPVEVIFYEKEL